MATTNNSRFLTVSNRRDTLEVGWSVRVRDYKSMTSLVAIIPQFQSLQFSMELNAVGSGSITMDEDDPWFNSLLANGLRASSLRDREYVFEIWEGETPRFAFLNETVTEGVIAEDETRTVTFAGPGLAAVLNWACIMRPGWPTPVPITGYKEINTSTDGKTVKKEKIAIYRDNSSSDLKSAFLWRFPIDWSTMRMWVTTFHAAQRRGLLKFVKPQFSATLDSERKKWEWVSTINMIAEANGYQPQEPAQTLLDWLQECTGQDNSVRFGQRLEWMMYPDFKLHVRQQFGVDRSGLPGGTGKRGTPVRFFAGQILSNERVRTRDKIFNRVTAVDVEGNETIVTSKGSVTAWNLREQRNETHKNVTIPALRAKIAQKLLAQQAPEKNQWTIRIPYDDPGGRVPFRDFTVGDWIGFAADNANPNNIVKYRVMAISVSMSAESTVPECELTLQTVLEAQMIQLERDITTLLNKPKNFSLADLKDIVIPEKPGYKAVLQYDPKTKKWKAVLVADPDDPASPVPGTPGDDGDDGSSSGGNRVFIQPTDPAATASNNVQSGDFWFKTVS